MEYQKTSQQYISNPDLDLTIKDILLQILRGKWIIVSSVFITVLLVSIWMWIAPQKYTAQVVIMPSDIATNLQNSSVSDFKLFGIGSDEETTGYTQFLNALSSHDLAKRLEKKHAVSKVIYSNQWNEENNEWVPPRGLVASIRSIVNKVFFMPEWSPPGADALASNLKENIILSTPSANNSSIINLSYIHQDPIFAKNLLTWIINEAELIVKERDTIKAQNAIQYLTEKLAQSTLIEQKQALSTLLFEEEQKKMMSSIDGPYIVEILEPVYQSSRPTSPRPLFYLFLAVILGGFLGVLYTITFTASKLK